MALGIGSIVAFIATALLVPYALARMPKDYFMHERDPRETPLVLRVLKNAVGVVLVLLGLAMLVLPGQGLITVALGLGLVDFPGRRRVELAVIGRPGILRTVNRLRDKLGREPLELPHRG
jgi:hypothetical protein